MRELINVTKALSDENRVRALMMLRNGELCVCQLIEMLRLAPSTVSKHMSILRQAQLVTARKEGRWSYYRLADDDASEHIVEVIQWVEKLLTADKQVLKDAQQLKAVRKMDIEKLCAHYKKPEL